MIILGLLLGIIGADVNSGTFRFDFGIAELQDGIDFVAISMGLFGFTEIIVNLSKGEARDSITEKVGSIWPSRKELCKAAPAITRGTLLGSFLGILPGGGALLASFASYTLEKKSAAAMLILRLVKEILPVSPVLNPPTMPELRRVSFRCSHSVFPATPRWR